VKGRLQMLVESESLFNDGTAAVLFAISLAVVAGINVSAVGIGASFVLTTLGGMAVGAIIAGAGLLMAGRTQDHLVEITFTSIAAYSSFLLADYFQLSGVLATLTAGIILGNVGPVGAISEKGRETVESFWEYIAFVANSLVFLLIGIGLAIRPIGSTWQSAIWVNLFVLAGRAVAVYGCCLLFAKSRGRVQAKDQHVLFWGGLRGALALALALSLPAGFERRQELLNVSFAVVAFSVIVQGLTINPLLRKLS
jgi:monovalent cation:H+ antiporter, CPA1 family